MRIIKTIIALSIAFLTLLGCASNFAIYEAPTAGPLSKLTFNNAAKNQAVSLVTFDDGSDCTGGRNIRFENDNSIPAGSSRSTTIGAGRELAIFATLNTIESDDYSVELGVTGSGPAPVVSRTVLAIGCNAGVSFPVEPDNHYRMVISEPDSSESCSIAVSKIDANGLARPVEITERNMRSPRGDPGSYCEPLDK